MRKFKYLNLSFVEAVVIVVVPEFKQIVFFLSRRKLGRLEQMEHLHKDL